MFGSRELLELCTGISLLPGDRTRIAGARDNGESFQEEEVLGALEELARRTVAARIRLDLTGGLLERLLGTPKPKSPRREWFLARKDLALVWKEALNDEPSALGLSLSHTKGAWLAAARALDFETAQIRTAHIGVDMEVADRAVSDRLLERFANPADGCPGLSRIGLWAAKEALFKGDRESASRTLKDYAVKLDLNESGFFGGTGMLPDGRTYAACLAGNGRYILAAAADTSPPVR